MLPQRAGDDFRFYPRLAAKHLANRFEQFRLAHDFHQGAARGGRHIQTENLRKAGIGKNQSLGIVHHRDAFDHASENRGGKVAFFFQGLDRAVQTRGSAIERSAQRLERITGIVPG
jgi:hypothetical protein